MQLSIARNPRIVHLVELLSYRELLRNFVARDLKVRYRNSVLGFLWCLVNPLLMMVVYTVVFTVLLKSNIERFPVFILIGILAWNLNSTALTGAAASIVSNAGLVMKVYFPRELLPLSVVLSNTVNFVLALVTLFGMVLVFQVHLGPSLLMLPVILLVQVIFCSGVAFLLSTLTVFYRDVEIITDTLMLAWFFLTPIFYRIEDVFPAYARILYIANPMASVIAAYRDVLYYGSWPALDFFSRTAVTAVVVFVAGYLFFNRFADRFAEEL
ncbi:MAG: ABC transporter permease [Chloroflexi bacterium]|nr:ABC transporter permease [Chloroflexota bacterium]MCL5109293.1 ABC transporter permease [Chloroflexota bacterium]